MAVRSVSSRHRGGARVRSRGRLARSRWASCADGFRFKCDPALEISGQAWPHRSRELSPRRTAAHLVRVHRIGTSGWPGMGAIGIGRPQGVAGGLRRRARWACHARNARSDNDPAGHRALLAWARATDPDAFIGVEGSSSFEGAGRRGSSSRPGARSGTVSSPQLSRRERIRTRRPARATPADALAIARVTARESGLPPVRLADGSLELRSSWERARTRSSR